MAGVLLFSGHLWRYKQVRRLEAIINDSQFSWFMTPRSANVLYIFPADELSFTDILQSGLEGSVAVQC